MHTNLSRFSESKQKSFRVIHKSLFILFLIGILSATVLNFQLAVVNRFKVNLIFMIIGISYPLVAWVAILAAAKGSRKRYLILIGVSLLALIIFVASGAFTGAFYRAALGGCIYFAASLLCRKMGIGWFTIFLALLAPVIILFDTGLGDPEYQIIGLAPVVGFALGVAVDYSRLPWISSILSLGLIAFLAFVCYPNYFNYLTKQSIPVGNQLAENKFISNKNDTLDVSALSQKVVLLDLWYSSCAICFQTMPKTQKLYERYKNDPDVIIAAVNVPMGRDSADAAWSLMAKYSLPKFKTLSDLQANPWGVSGYPTAIVFDKDRKVRYMGELEFNPVVRDNVYALIERLKEE